MRSLREWKLAKRYSLSLEPPTVQCNDEFQFHEYYKRKVLFNYHHDFYPRRDRQRQSALFNWKNGMVFQRCSAYFSQKLFINFHVRNSRTIHEQNKFVESNENAYYPKRGRQKQSNFICYNPDKGTSLILLYRSYLSIHNLHILCP